MILINGAGFKESITNLGDIITRPLSKRKPIPKIHLKYIDDMTIAEAIDLKKRLSLILNHTHNNL